MGGKTFLSRPFFSGDWPNHPTNEKMQPGKSREQIGCGYGHCSG
jgi:hypothetical protein